MRPRALAVLRLMKSSTLVACLNWHVARLLATEYPAGINANKTISISKIGSITHQAAGHDEVTQGVNSGNRMAHRQRDELVASADAEGIGTDDETAPARSWTKVLKAASICPSLLAFRIWISCPRARAAACTSLVTCAVIFGSVGFTSTPNTLELGTSSCNNSNCFATNTAM